MAHLTHDQLAAIITAGGSVIVAGKVITRTGDLPTDEQLTADEVLIEVGGRPPQSGHGLLSARPLAPLAGEGALWVATDQGNRVSQAQGGAWHDLFVGLGINLPDPAGWSADTDYVERDTATRAGSTYVCILDHTNHAPPNATYWALVAEKGDQGDPGDPGEQGEPGPGGTASKLSFPPVPLVNAATVSLDPSLGTLFDLSTTDAVGDVTLNFTSPGTDGDVVMVRHKGDAGNIAVQTCHYGTNMSTTPSDSSGPGPGAGDTQITIFITDGALWQDLNYKQR